MGHDTVVTKMVGAMKSEDVRKDMTHGQDGVTKNRLKYKLKSLTDYIPLNLVNEYPQI